MCGIAGSLNWAQQDTKQNTEAMVNRLVHRGPDACGTKQIGPAILGHRRLSVIDTSQHANQPLSDHSGRYWISYNGEIYNFKALRDELLAAGAQFSTHSDTEVILEGWKHWGPETLERLVGMFAFALWDNTQQELVLARDRVGEKPLFYMPFKNQELAQGVIFASELNALQAHDSFNYQVNHDAINQFLSLNYILTDSCIINNCYKLPPAHYITFKHNKEPELACYWDLARFFQNKREISEKSAIEELDHLLSTSLSGQSISDVPLGSFLSGGIDSSAIVSTLVNHHILSNPETYSIGFLEKTFSELDASNAVANHIGVAHHTKIVDIDMAGVLPKLAVACGEPFADTSMIPTYYLAQYARESVTVCLSGDGSDELFLGYDSYTASKFLQKTRFIPSALLSQTFNLASHVIPTKFNKSRLTNKLKRFSLGCQKSHQEAFYLWKNVFSDAEKTELINPDYHNTILKNNTFDSFKQYYQKVSGCHPLDQASYIDISTWLTNDILVKVDRMSMQNSLEVRAPFLNHHLIEFAASLPVKLKLKHWEKKYLLKKHQAQYLPHDIIYQRKKGFNPPISLWLCNELNELGKSTTLNNSQMPWLNQAYIQKLWKEHEAMKVDHGQKLFNLMCLGIWLNDFPSN